MKERSYQNKKRKILKELKSILKNTHNNRLAQIFMFCLIILITEIIRLIILDSIKMDLQFRLLEYLPYLVVFALYLFYLVFNSHTDFELTSKKELINAIYSLSVFLVCSVLYILSFWENSKNSDLHKTEWFIQGFGLAWILLIQEKTINSKLSKIATVIIFAFLPIILTAKDATITDIKSSIVRAIFQSFYMIVLISLNVRSNTKTVQTLKLPEPAKSVDILSSCKTLIEFIPENIILLDLNGEIIFNNSISTKFYKSHGFNSVKELFDNTDSLSKKETSDIDNQVVKYTSGLLTSKLDFGFDSSPFNNRKQNINLTDFVGTIGAILMEHPYKTPLNYEGSIKSNSWARKCNVDIKMMLLNELENQMVFLTIKELQIKDEALNKNQADNFSFNLLSSLSHEFRTPLNAILNFLSLALNCKIVEEGLRAEYLMPAYKSAQLLGYLLYDTMDFAKITIHELNLHYESVFIEPILKKCVGLLEIQAKKKKIEIKVEFDHTINRKIHTDPQRLSQIVINLLSNAVKYTFKGTITLKAMRYNQNIRISVIDTGIGLKSDEIERLRKGIKNLTFAEKINQNSPGVGLGLKISHILSNLIGPNDTGIQFISKENEGSNFYFEIEDKKIKKETFFTESVHSAHNLAVGENERNLNYVSSLNQIVSSKQIIMNISNQEDGSMPSLPDQDAYIPDAFISDHVMKIGELSEKMMYSFNSARMDSNRESLIKQNSYCKGLSIYKEDRDILIVDDEPFNILTLEKLIGKKCDSAYNGLEALQTIRDKFEHGNPGRNYYAMIFMDYNMPIMNGIEATSKIRNLVDEMKIPNIYIVGCTAHSDVQDECLSAGMDECLIKPLKKKDIESLLEKKSLIKQGGRRGSLRKM